MLSSYMLQWLDLSLTGSHLYLVVQRGQVLAVPHPSALETKRPPFDKQDTAMHSLSVLHSTEPTVVNCKNDVQ